MKIFFFDIDGTLAYHTTTPEYNLEMLKNLKQKGYLTFICSGRASKYANSLYGDLVSGYICSNGRYVLYQGKPILTFPISKQEIDEYQKIILECGGGYTLTSDEFISYENIPDKQIEQRKKAYSFYTFKEGRIDDNYYCFDLYYYSLKMRDLLIEKLQNKMIVNDHNGIGNADCTTCSFNKGSAIGKVMEYFHIAKEDAYAFGDGYNDLPMFDYVGHGIAMGNAVPELKAKATYVSTNFDDYGIVNALKREGIL